MLASSLLWTYHLYQMLGTLTRWDLLRQPHLWCLLQDIFQSFYHLPLMRDLLLPHESRLRLLSLGRNPPPLVDEGAFGTAARPKVMRKQKLNCFFCVSILSLSHVIRFSNDCFPLPCGTLSIFQTMITFHLQIYMPIRRTSLQNLMKLFNLEKDQQFEQSALGLSSILARNSKYVSLPSIQFRLICNILQYGFL